MRRNLKSIVLALAPIIAFGQNAKEVSTATTSVEPFVSKSKKFNDWSISVGLGTAALQNADLSSFYKGRPNLSWNTYVSLDKQITHAFGLSLQYQTGQTRQKAVLQEKWGVATGHTKYNQIALLGDFNFSNFMRRTDVVEPFRLALHGYVGIGLQGYTAFLTDNGYLKKWPNDIKQDLGISSFFYQIGTGVKYKLSDLVDLEARVMYVFTGDDEFDGGGWADPQSYKESNKDKSYNQINDSRSDNMVVANIGASFKLGKHQNHLAWFDPMQDSYKKLSELESKTKEPEVCTKGDADNDGICDDWDRQLDTPAGARVDGSGVALDIDLDGVIDLYDKCVTVPGKVEFNGCPQ